MKIALINNIYAPVARGGAERIVELQAEILRQAGHKVVVVTTKPWGTDLAKHDDGIFRIGGLCGGFFHLGRLPAVLRFLWHILSWLDLATPWYISLKLALTGCQAAIGHNLTGLSLWLPRFLSGYNIRYIQVLHDIQYLHPSGLMYKGQEARQGRITTRIYQMLTRHNLSSATKIISPSHWLAELHLQRGLARPDQIQIFANPVALQNIPLKNLTEPSCSILFIGQLERHKGIIELIKAFKQTTGVCELIIASDGSLRDYISELAMDDHRISIIGWQSHDKILQLISKSMLLVLPSTCYENLPTVILEAFAAKLPVMGSNWGGIKELLEDDCGILINPLDHESFVKALQDAINIGDVGLRPFAERAYQKIKHYEDENYRDKLLNLLA